MNRRTISTVLIAASFIGFSCSEDDPKTPLIIPAEYDGSAFEANTTTQIQVLTNLSAIANEVKKGRTNGTTVPFQNLSALYTAGAPSLKSVSTAYFAGKMEGADGYMDELSKASGGTYTPGTPSGEGGVYGNYLFDENGLEIEQVIEKGQFGSVLYKHATDLLEGNITAATVDQLVAIFGASPSFPNTYNGAKTNTPDRFLANYATRRDKNDGTGFYTQMKDAFIKLQAALKAGDEYKQEQQEAISAITFNWEKINAATVINYCQATTAALSATNPTDAQKSGALHSYGEAVGFIHGWKTIPQPYKKITDAEIDEVLVLFNAPANGIPTSYKFVTDAVTELPKLQQAITKLKSIYGFTDQEVEEFKNNWVTAQER